jgi:hypothetical protein
MTDGSIRLTEEKHWWVVTKVWGEETSRISLHDPFMRHEVEMTLSWRDRLRILFGRKVAVTVVLTADRDTINAVMRLTRDESTGHIVLPPTIDGPSHALAT